jgi:alkanesulfonate monooxygenase SsuD/methylene tetrahydromethanopterin reductase-like flavin-dependent oxidoreductase (luciferase family)
MTGPKTVASHVGPLIRGAADKAGKPEPRVVVGLPVSVTDAPDRAREQAAANFAVYGGLPSYRAMLDREGAAGPADVAVVGDEQAVVEQINEVFDAGATEFVAALFGGDDEIGRTRACLRSLL